MQIVGRINRDIYRCVAENIMADEVIITDERIEHIKARHPGDYERYVQYINTIISEPDFILEANKPNTAFLLKEINAIGSRFQLILRIKISTDPEAFKNSVITFLKIEDKKWAKYLRNKKILYKRE